MLTIAAQHQWEKHQMNVFNVFLQGDLNDEIYMELPQGFHSQGEKRVCRLIKSLYGLKQAARQWNTKLSESLLKFQLKQSELDHSLFIKKIKVRNVVVLIYVDDMSIPGDSIKVIKQTKADLKQTFKMKNLGDLKSFLGIEFARSKLGILMHQRKYSLKLIAEAGLNPNRCTRWRI